MRIALIDDETLFREGLEMLISGLDSSASVDSFSSCENFLEKVDEHHYDLILLDFHLSGASEFEAISGVKAKFPATPIVTLSSEDNPALIRKTIEQGASGFIPKSSTGEVLVATLNLILAGGIYLPPYALPPAPAPKSEPGQRKIRTAKTDHLSDRQREALDSAVRGKVNKVIAREMQITEATVKAHLSAAYRVLGIKNRTEAIYALANSVNE